jgi:hypothetical protein
LPSRGFIRLVALEAMPGDGPSLALLKRIESLRRDPPAVDWDGTWHMDGK